MVFKNGSRGETVRQIQKALKVYPDGVFGPMTEEAVRKFQAEKGLKVDGIVGAATLAKLGIVAIQQYTGLKKTKRNITEIIVHCTATPEGRDATVKQIREDHIKNRGFSDIAYHYVIYRDGTVHEGRDIEIAGAHCIGHNGNSIGVAYVGGVENKPGVPYEKQKAKDTRTIKQKHALLSLLMDLKKLYPYAKIYGHRDFANKPCPSFDAKTEYRKL